VKKLIYLLVLSCSFIQLDASARQYIQCALPDTWDRAVINLDGENSTFFMTNGVHLPDEIRVLKGIELLSEDSEHTVYQTRQEDNQRYGIREKISIPSPFINIPANSFDVELTIQRESDGYSQRLTLDCFSALYP
jgi:hypothetical protein